MLNQAVADQVLTIAGNGESGVLWLNGEGMRLRFCFQDGTPVALDLGRDKDAILADKLLEYHKIGPELHRMLGDVIAANQGAIAAGQSPVLDFLGQQEALAPGEAEQVTQAMVEDSLVQALSGEVHELTFVPDEGIDAFDFARSALRIRIDAQMLVSTAKARAEEDAIARGEVGGPDTVFSLEEREGGSAPLTEHERMVLAAIDGRRSVDEIAAELRDSWPRVARVLRILVAKKIIRRVAGLGSKTRAALDAMRQETSQPAGGATIITAEPQRRGPRPVVLAIAAGGLAVAAGLWWLVEDYNKRRAVLDAISAQVQQAIAVADYPAALAAVEDARKAAANDFEANRHAEDLAKEVEEAIVRDLDAVAAAIAEADFPLARGKLARLPPSERRRAAADALAEAEEAFRVRSESLAAAVSTALAQDDIPGALAAAARDGGRAGAAAVEVIDRWRIGRIEQAQPPGVPPAKRQALIAQVRSAAPTPAQAERLAAIEQDIERQLADLAARIRDLAAEVDAGAWQSALDGIQALGEQAAGTPLADELTRLRERCAAVQAAVDAYLAAAQTAARQGAEQDLARAEADGAKLIAAQAKAPNIGAVRQAVEGLGHVRAALARPTMSEQAAALDAWIATAGGKHIAAEAATFRRDQLRLAESTLAAALDAARRAASDGDLALARTALEALAAKSELARSALAAEVQRLLGEVRAGIAERQAREAELDAAMAAGDIAKAREMAVRMNLRYLPLQVESVPAGAEVAQDGKPVGRTPLVLRISAAERSESLFELRLDGYGPATAAGSAASGGWRLSVPLQRLTAATAEAGHTLTGRPAAIGDRVWIASRSALAAIDREGRTAVLPLDAHGGALQQPVYAPAVDVDGAILVGTRDGVALRIAGERVERLPLGGGTDFAPAVYHSAFTLDRIYVVVAGDDGRLHALHPGKPTDQWHGEPGEPFAAGPVVAGDRILAVRRNGRLESVTADDGKPAGGADLGRPVAGAWMSAGRLAGVAGAMAWTWDGGAPALEELPAEAAAAADGVIVTAAGRVWLRQEGGWRELPRIDGKPTGTPVGWAGHAAIPVGRTLVVTGPRQFTVDLGSDALDPAVLPDGRLVAASVQGRILIYAP